MQQDPGFTLNGTRVLLFFVCFTLLLFFIGKNELRCQEVKHKGKVVIQELDAFVKELERIRDQYQEQDRFPQNVFVEGVINPGNRKFTLVTRDGKMRLDMDVLIPGANGTSERRTVHRLNDGRIFYAVNNDGLAINNLDHFVSNWRSSLASRIYQFYMPDLDGLKTVDEFCDYLQQHIHVHKEEVTKAIASGQLVFQITTEGPLHTIEVSGPMADDGSGRIDVRRIVLDKRYGYLPVRFQRIEMPERGASLWKRTYQFESNYQEIAPGIYFLSQGKYERTFSAPESSHVKKGNNFSTNIKISKVKTDDFKIAEDYFDLRSLKMLPGFYVYDRRVQPPLEYTFKESRLGLKILSDVLQNSSELPTRAKSTNP